MIEIPMVSVPDILSDLLGEFRPLFDRRQFRQFSRYIASSWASPTRSVAHLNGIFVEHTNQSNLNRYSSDPVLVLDDTILPRKGKHIEG
ncbi:hypothetical protein B1A_03873, partial [mine drainage metagenome]